MTLKPFVTSAARLLPAVKFLAIPLLMLGAGSSLLAQPSSYTYDYSVSFTGTGTLPVSQTSYTNNPPIPDPKMTISLTGTGQDVDTLAFPIVPGLYGEYYTSSTFNTSASFTLPNTVDGSTSPFNVEGLNFSAQGYGYNFPPSPFYDLFPPAGNTEYSGSLGPSGPLVDFQYDPSTVLTMQFDGETNNVILGPTYTRSQNGNVVTFTYAGSQVDLSATIGELDPMVDFTGNFVISTTVASAPDAAPGLVGILTLLGVCAGGVWQRKVRTA